MASINIAIVGAQNCTSFLVQRFEYYRGDPGESLRLMLRSLGGFTPEDIQIVSAFNIDVRKVNRPLHKANLAHSKSTKQISKDVPNLGVTVRMAPLLDGVATHMKEYHPDHIFVPAGGDQVNMECVSREGRSEYLLDYASRLRGGKSTLTPKPHCLRALRSKLYACIHRFYSPPLPPGSPKLESRPSATM